MAGLSLEQAKLAAETTYYATAALGLLVAGIWALWRLRVRREEVWNLRIGWRHEVHPQSEAVSLLVLRLRLTNIGRIMLRPGRNGIVVRLRELPRELAAAGRILTWSDGTDILSGHDLVGSRPSAGEVDWELEPGAEYEEIIAVTVPAGALLMARATFHWRKDEDQMNSYHIIETAETFEPPIDVTVRTAPEG